MNKPEIIQTALAQLPNHPGLQVRWMPDKKKPEGDLWVHLNKKKIRVHLSVQRELREFHLAKILEEAKHHTPFMVIALHIFDTLKTKLREHGINYLDGAGNIYLWTEVGILWLDGKKRMAKVKAVPNKAFTKAGLKLIFHWLNNPDAINEPYRVIAAATGVALGGITSVIEGLKEAGYILQVDPHRQVLKNKKALLQRWMAGYGEILKPSLHEGNYKFWEGNKKLDKWQDLPLKHGEDFWGAEPAAEMLTGYLRAQHLTVYTERSSAAIIPAWSLMPDKQGPVAIYKKFWKVDEGNNSTYAPVLLVYADLLLTDDPRNHETAQLIYDQYLRDQIERNVKLGIS